MALLKRLVLSAKVVKTIENWPTYFKDYFGKITTETYTLRLRGGPEFELRRNTVDRGIITEVAVNAEYGLPERIEGIVVDIGAQIGIFSVLAASRGATVVAYEPTEENYRLLQANIKRNGLAKRVAARNTAVSDKKRRLTFYLDDKNTGGHSALFKTKRSIRVNAIGLDDLFAAHKITSCEILKIDTEGSEYPILYNASDATLRSIKRIELEWHEVRTNKRYNAVALGKFLEKKGFTVTNVDPYLLAVRE